ncbi:hypothetical protein [Rhodococcus sp. NPDC058481]|uniref:hypothetical protein n=1 Tax=unclassified Rhodococcus (in: high G+C Gram-positive bacteria) TaxID=192944 RepID=UPI003658D700
MTNEHEEHETPGKHERRWVLPEKLFGRARTSTVILGVAFLATLLLYGYLNQDPENTETGQVAPVPTTPRSPEYTEPTTSTPPTTSAVPSTTAEATTTTPSPTTPPAIVLPPWVSVPSGMELPPGVVTATPEAPTSAPTPTP